MARFVHEVGKPALDAVANELRESGLRAEVEDGGEQAALTVYHGDETEFVYSLHVRGYTAPAFAVRDFAGPASSGKKYYRAEVFLQEGSQHYDVMDYTREELISDVLSQYDKHMHFLHVAAR